MSSLRLRLLLGALLGISAALVVAGLFLVGIFAAHVRERYVKELDDHLLQLAAVIQVDAAGGATLKHDLSDPAFQRPLSGLYWQVSDSGRVVLRSRSLWDATLPPVSHSDKPGELREGDVPGPAGQSLILVERLVLLQLHGKHPLRLAVAGDRRVIDEARGDFARRVALSLAVLGALLAAASGLQISAGLAPLRALHRQLIGLRKGRAERLEGNYPREISALVEDLNALLATQASEVARARTNAGKLGHGLKTPLAVLTAEARALRERGDGAAATAIEHEVDMRSDRDAVELTVEDDGPGIAQDRLEEVITHGTRLDRTVPGTGIGLAIVQDLAALHGGSVALSQSPLGGVRVTVRFPSRGFS